MKLIIETEQHGFGTVGYWTAVIKNSSGAVLASSAGATMREAIDNALDLIS